MNGQTFGKKVMKIQVISVNEQKKVGGISYFLRAIIQNNILITVIQIVILFTFTKDNYYMIYNNVNMVGYILLYFIVFLVLVRKDSRGLHDLLAGTQVIFVSNENASEIKDEDSHEPKEILLNEEKPKKEKNLEKDETKKKPVKETKKNTKKGTKPKTKS